MDWCLRACWKRSNHATVAQIEPGLSSHNNEIELADYMNSLGSAKNDVDVGMVSGYDKKDCNCNNMIMEQNINTGEYDNVPDTTKMENTSPSTSSDAVRFRSRNASSRYLRGSL